MRRSLPAALVNHVWRGRTGLAAALCIGFCAGTAHGQQARITKLTDVAFGTISNLGIDASRSQNVCAYSSASLKGYSVRATGSGTSGAFSLVNGARQVAYEVQWSGTSGQTSGTALSSGVTLGGFVSTASSSNCSTAPLTTASLIVLLRAATLSTATAGTYSGTLTLIIAPE
ncbi:MAG TPA: hypothetical protein VJ890_10950 [Vineibacter sp.]|nr:hypothetical protein [Vineibacter sp.]